MICKRKIVSRGYISVFNQSHQIGAGTKIYISSALQGWIDEWIEELPLNP